MSDEAERAFWRAHTLARDWPSWERWARFAGRSGLSAALDLLRACERWEPSQERMNRLHRLRREAAAASTEARYEDAVASVESVNCALYRRVRRAIRELRRLDRVPVDGTDIPRLMKHIYSHRQYIRASREVDRARRLREASDPRPTVNGGELTGSYPNLVPPAARAYIRRLVNENFPDPPLSARASRPRPALQAVSIPPAVESHMAHVEQHVARDAFIEREMFRRTFRRDPQKSGHWSSETVTGIEVRHRTIVRWLSGLWPDEAASTKKIADELDAMLRRAAAPD